MSGVAHTFARFKTKSWKRLERAALGGHNQTSPVKIRLLPLDVDGVYWIEAKPRRKRKAAFVGPLGQRRQHDGLHKVRENKIYIRNFDNLCVFFFRLG